jgi:hypothetical protein
MYYLIYFDACNGKVKATILYNRRKGYLSIIYTTGKLKAKWDSIDSKVAKSHILPEFFVAAVFYKNFFFFKFFIDDLIIVAYLKIYIYILLYLFKK